MCDGTWDQSGEYRGERHRNNFLFYPSSSRARAINLSHTISREWADRLLHISDAFPPTVFYLLPTSGRSFNNGLNERMARKHARIRSRFAITLRITKVYQR